MSLSIPIFSRFLLWKRQLQATKEKEHCKETCTFWQNVKNLFFFFISSWIEFWQRKRRQYVCSSQTWTDTIFRSFMNSPCQIYGRYNCYEEDDDLRETKCSNKGSKSLMEVCMEILNFCVLCLWFFLFAHHLF